MGKSKQLNWLDIIFGMLFIIFILIGLAVYIAKNPIQRKASKNECINIINESIKFDGSGSNKNIENYTLHCGDVFKSFTDGYKTPYKIIGKTLEVDNTVISLNGVLLHQEEQIVGLNKFFVVIVTMASGKKSGKLASENYLNNRLFFGKKEDADNAFQLISMAMR